MSDERVKNMPNSISNVLLRGNQLKRYIPRIEYIDGKDQDKHGYYILWFLQGNIQKIQF